MTQRPHTDTETDTDSSLTDQRVDLSAPLRDRIVSAVGGDTAEPAPGHLLAQMNVARFRAPMDDPSMAGFVEMLDPINHHAEAADGFVWRLTDEGSNNATSIVFYDDPLLLVNMSVWRDMESLRDYVYRGDHVQMVKRRHEWADAFESTYLVLWWIDADHRPTIAEGDERLRMREANGPTPQAFTFGRAFPPPAG